MADTKELANSKGIPVPTMRKISGGIPEQQEILQSRKLSSRIGLEKLVEKVGIALDLRKNKAIWVTDTFISCLEDVLVENLETNGFAIKLNKFGKLTVRHRPASLRKIPFTGETKLSCKKRKVKFVTLGKLRQLENAAPSG